MAAHMRAAQQLPEDYGVYECWPDSLSPKGGK